MANPQVPQGTLNRLRGSVVLGNFPALNVTAPFLAKEAISIAFEGDGAILVPTMTGGVQSPEPYIMVVITANILKTQNLAALYKAQFELDTNIGPISVYPDSATLPEYDFVNCVMAGAPRELVLDGNQAGFSVTYHGIYQINSSLWGA